MKESVDERPGRLRGPGALLARDVAVLWVATRIGFVAVTYLAMVLHLFHAQPAFSGLILSWRRWDAGWYEEISRQGYFTPQAFNFFPLYPKIWGAIAWVLGHGSGPVYPQPDRLRLLVGMALSNLGLLVGLYAIARLAEHDGGAREDAGPRAVRIALAYPFALTWTIAYAEGFFLAFAGLTLLFARRGRWYPAALTAALAGLTRPVALILVLPLAWEYGRQHGWWARVPRPSWGELRLAARGALVVGAAPAAIAAYFAYAYSRTGDFLLPLHNQFTYWQHVSMPQWTSIHIALHRILTMPRGTGILPLELGLLFLFGLITLARIRRLPFAYTLYMAGLLYLATSSPTPSQVDLFWGASRYLAGAIPVYLIVADWAAGRRWLEGAVLGAGFLLQGALTIALFQSQPIL